MARSLLPASVLLLCAALGACGSAGDAEGAGDDAITSSHGRILDFAFKGEVVAEQDLQARTAIVAQLAYTQGILTTAEGANGEVGQVTVEFVESRSESGKKTITYSAHLPVTWPKDRNAIPKRYDLPLPKDVTPAGLDHFNKTYDGACGENHHGSETFWHDFNPKLCTLADADVTRASATVTPFAGETSGKYPEYDLMWQDGELDVVATFGLIAGNTDIESDWGVVQYDKFIAGSLDLLTGSAVAKNHASASILRDTTVTGTATIAGQSRRVKIDVLLVSELADVGADFDQRYDRISEKADLIMYLGHSGLGSNITVLASKGKVAAGKYQLILLNGCQTFAYIDTTMNDRRIAANGAAVDPKGTRFMDVVANALPSSITGNTGVSLTLVGAALQADAPRTFNELLNDMPRDQLPVVFGEEDNRFRPSK